MVRSQTTRPFCNPVNLLAHQSRQVTLPVKIRAGVGLASGGNVAVTGDAFDRKGGAQREGQFVQHGILRVGEWHVVTAFQLDADGKIVAARPALPNGYARVPGALQNRNELDELTLAADVKVR